MAWKASDDVEPEKGGGFELLKEGKYRFRVENAEPQTWPSGDWYWKLTLVPIEGMKGVEVPDDRKIWFNVSFPEAASPTASASDVAKQKKRMARTLYHLRSLGLDPSEGVDEQSDFAKIIGRTVSADVEHDSYMKDGKKREIERVWDIDPDDGPGSVDGSMGEGGEKAEEGFGSSEDAADIPF